MGKRFLEFSSTRSCQKSAKHLAYSKELKAVRILIVYNCTQLGFLTDYKKYSNKDYF